MSFNFIRSTIRPSTLLRTKPPIRAPHFKSPKGFLSTQVQQNNRLPTWIGLTTLVLTTSTLTYTFYPKSEEVFPKDIKKILRLALLAERNGDLVQSKKCFMDAYEHGKMELDLMKLSGIGIRWASMLERFQEFKEAKEVYTKVYKELEKGIAIGKGKGDEGFVKMRMVSVAQKLASISEDQKEVERYLAWSVEELLKLTLPQGNRSRENGKEKERIVLGELDLPEWVKEVELGSCLESLGDFYAKHGPPEYSLTLYLQALSILLPPKPRQKEPTILEKCHASIIMNNISQLHVQRKPYKIKESREWLKKALELIPVGKDLTDEERFECLKNRMVIEENLGTLDEMMGDFGNAKQRFSGGKMVAEELGVRSWIDRCDENLNRIQSKESGQKDTTLS